MLCDVAMRAAQCFMKRTKGQVFRLGGRGLGLHFSVAVDCVSDMCERQGVGGHWVRHGSRPRL